MPRRVTTVTGVDEQKGQQHMNARRRRTTTLVGAIAAMSLLAAPAVAQDGPQWPMTPGDAQGSNQSTVEGPDDPGLKWHVDFEQVETDFAPDGYGSIHRNYFVISEDGTLVLLASNNDRQYENSARFARELIGVDPDDGEVLWQVDNASPRSSSRCAPAIDDQDRIWIETRPDGGDRVLSAHDPADGSELTSIEAESPRCSDHLLIDGDHLVSASSGNLEDFRILDISGDDPTEVSVGLEVEGGDDLVNHGNSPSWAVMADGSLYTAVEIVDEDGDTERLDIVEVDLATGDVVNQREAPTPNGSDSADFSRLHLALDAGTDTLLVATDSGEPYVAGLDTGDLIQSWIDTRLNDNVNDLALGDGTVLFQPGSRTSLGGPDTVALATADGALQYSDGIASGSSLLTNPDGSGYGMDRGEGDTRNQLIARFDAGGQVQWQIPPERIVQQVDGIDERDDLNMGNRFARIEFPAIDADGTLYAVSRGGSSEGMLAIDNSGGLSEPIDVSFPDVDPDSTHAANIEELARRGITQGDADGNYNPNGPVPREQFATFLVRALGIEAIEGTSRFDDVQVGSTHAANIEAAAEAGITRGTTETEFSPRREITRAEVASLLARAFDLEGIEGTTRFDDVEVGSTHAANIEAVAEAGITEGDGTGNFNPDTRLNRAQMASLLIRALDAVDG